MGLIKKFADYAGNKHAIDPTGHTHTTSESWLSSLIATLQTVANKVTSLSSSSTDTQYPSAKCVYDELSGKVDWIDNGFNDTIDLDEYIQRYSMCIAHIRWTNNESIQLGNLFTSSSGDTINISPSAKTTETLSTNYHFVCYICRHSNLYKIVLLSDILTWSE